MSFATVAPVAAPPNSSAAHPFKVTHRNTKSNVLSTKVDFDRNSVLVMTVAPISCCLLDHINNESQVYVLPVSVQLTKMAL